MNEFELLRNITIGQYLPTGSYLYRMDPRAKIVATILVVGAMSFTHQPVVAMGREGPHSRHWSIIRGSVAAHCGGAHGRRGDASI